jgi:muramoyltetrapeptide carboxypeptidase
MPEIKENIFRIRIVSPSGAINPDLIDGATDRLRSWGFEVTEGRFAREVYGRFAGTEEQRINDLQDAINDQGLTAILCSRGGYGLAPIIDRIDFSPLIKHPKWLIGFSDITVIHAALSRLNIPSIHAVMAKHLSELPDDSASLQYLRKILIGELPEYHIASDKFNRIGNAKGRLVGGNLSVLMGLRGTSYEPEYKGIILFLEEIAEEPYHIDRMMQNLRMGGVINEISGLIVGHFTNCTEDPLMQKSVKEIILDATADAGCPVCFGFPAGHEDENYPLIMGRELTLQVTISGTEINFN